MPFFATTITAVFWRWSGVGQATIGMGDVGGFSRTRAVGGGGVPTIGGPDFISSTAIAVSMHDGRVRVEIMHTKIQGIVMMSRTEKSS